MTQTMDSQSMAVGGMDVEVLRGGAGKAGAAAARFPDHQPQGAVPVRAGQALQLLRTFAARLRVNKRPKDFDTIYDLVRHTLDLIDTAPGDKITLIGFSFGGWLAAEAAVLRPAKLDRLILVDPLGIRISDRETRDILDIYNVHPDVVRDKSFHHPERFAPDFDAMEDAELVTFARNRDSLCLYSWNPLLYNPQLRGWLHRISVPTLVLWGASDGVVSPDYGRAYAKLIPHARFELIEHAGHHPEIEQPAEFVTHVADFMSGTESN